MAKNWKKRKLCRWMGLCLTVCILVISSLYTVCGAEPVIPVSVPVNTNIQAVCVHAPSAILMEASTGKILFEKEADENGPLAYIKPIFYRSYDGDPESIAAYSAIYFSEDAFEEI